jgi:hypothetical protein
VKNSLRGVFRFARDPVVWTNLVAALVMAASVFGLDLDTETQGAVNAVAVAVAGLITGWKVAVDGGVALVMGLFKALIALSIAFGLHWTDQQQLVVMTLITALGAAFVRTQVSPGEPALPPR